MGNHDISAIRTAGDYDYTCDLRRLPRLSDEERNHLVALLAEAQVGRVPSHAAQPAQERLIEGHLWLATVVAWECCPKERCPLIPDLIQEASLCLVQMAASFDYTSGENFTAWATVALRNQVRCAIGDDRFVRVPRKVRSRLRKTGRLADLDAFQPLSLDEVHREDEDCTLSRFIPEPEVSYRDPQQDAQKRAALEAWLLHLSPSAQQVIRLSFGLCDEDGRAQTPGELAALLGVTPKEVSSLKRSALLKLKAITEGRARGQRSQTKVPSPQRTTTSRATEKHARLERAALYLQREGQPITTAHLARLAEVSFLTAYALAKQADVHIQTAERFLERAGMLAVQNPQTRCTERLEQAYAQMQAEGTPITSSVLARRAGVHFCKHRARSSPNGRLPDTQGSLARRPNTSYIHNHQWIRGGHVLSD